MSAATAAPTGADTVRMPAGKLAQLLYGLARERSLGLPEDDEGWLCWSFSGLGTASGAEGSVSLDPDAPTYSGALRALERGASNPAALPELVAILVASLAVDGQRGRWSTAEVQRLLRGAAINSGKRGMVDRQVVADWLALLSAGDFRLDGRVRRLSSVPAKGRRKPSRKDQERDKARASYGAAVRAPVLVVERAGRSTTVSLTPEVREALRSVVHEMPATVLRLAPVQDVQRIGRQRAARVRVGAELYARARQSGAGADGPQGVQLQHLLERWAGADNRTTEARQDWERTASDVVVVLDDARRRGATGLRKAPTTTERGDRRVLHLTGRLAGAEMRHLLAGDASPSGGNGGGLASPLGEQAVQSRRSARVKGSLSSSLRTTDGRAAPRLAPGGHAQAVAATRAGAA